MTTKMGESLNQRFEDLATKDVKIPASAKTPEQQEVDDQIESGSIARSRPHTGDLKPAVVFLEDGSAVPLFDVNDMIVIERFASVIDTKPWLDTHVYRVQAIDDVTGNLKLWDTISQQFAVANFINGPARGDNYFLAPSSGVVGKKPTIEKPVAITPGGGKRRRGRPPGSKNRPKDVIVQEKNLKKAAMKEKHGRSKKQRRLRQA